MRKMAAAVALFWAAPALAQSAALPAPPPAVIASMAPEIRATFEASRQALHIPGTVYGIVRDGRLVLVEGLGQRNIESGAAVDADTRFRIASMSKAFTALAILKLRDEGKVDLEAPAARYVPQMAAWKLPTGDSRAITVRDLLHHTGGMVEDNPWGDRQQILSEADFTAMIASGMDLAFAPGERNEYSNYGYALLGRIITNVSGLSYQDYIRTRIMLPLGMTATGYDVFKSPPASRALGYRWQDEAWLREPDMRDGTFGAMGGVETTANDYAKWIAFLLSAWPARDDPDTGPVKRATVRDLIALAAPTGSLERPAELGAPCRTGAAYAAALYVLDDCELGRVVTHSGGYPGYGSLMILLPDAGVGVFAFNNRTYAGSRVALYKTLLALRRKGAIPDRAKPVLPGLSQAYAMVRAVWRSGDFARAALSGNVALDQDIARRARALAALKAKVGDCAMSEPVVPVSALEGTFTWACATGKVRGRVQRAPLSTVQLQVIDFAEALTD